MGEDSMKAFLAKRPLSWSAISSFQYSPGQWYAKYILGHKEPESEAMKFGKKIGEKLSSDASFLPEVLRYKVFEKELGGRIGDIPLVGFLDGFQEKPMAFVEYKTSGNTKKWTSKSVASHGQLDFYFFLLWLNYKVPPEKIKCNLVYIPV